MSKNHKTFLKNKLKYLKIFIFLIISFFVISPVIVFADATWVIPDPNIKISDELTEKLTQAPNCETGEDGKDICQIPWLSEYVAGIYKYAIGAVAILATVVMMIGGVVWITAGGSQTRIGEAKQYISGSLTGLVLVFCSYTILNIINPDLVKFKPIEIERVIPEDTTISDDRYGSCTWDIALSCYDDDKTLSAGYCDDKDKPMSGSSICCCKIAPIPGCTWRTACNTEKDSDISKCGTIEHKENETKCCCTE